MNRLLLIKCCLLIIGTGILRAQNSERSVALILKVDGKEKLISGVKVYKSSIFDGKVKNIHSLGSVHSSSALKVEVTDEKGNELCVAFLENPLDLRLESFDPDGSIHRSELEKDEGFVNLRFPLVQNSGLLTFRCSQLFTTKEEFLVSTFQFNPDEK